MASPETFLIVTGSLCLVIGLVEAWLLVALFASDNSPLSRVIPGRQDLLRSHIDYLMMSQFLFIFFVLFRTLEISPSIWLVGAICFGSLVNPLAFLIRAIRPGYQKNAPLPYTAMISTSCILATGGYGISAWLFAASAWR